MKVNPSILAANLNELIHLMNQCTDRIFSLEKAAIFSRNYANEIDRRLVHRFAIVDHQIDDDHAFIHSFENECDHVYQQCKEANDKAIKMKELAEVSLNDANENYEQWIVKLNEAMAWYERAEQRLMRAEEEYQRAVYNFEKAQDNLSYAIRKLERCRKNENRENCNPEIRAIERAEDDLDAAKYRLKEAEIELIEAKEEFRLATIRVNLCKEGVSYLEQAVKLASESLEFARQSLIFSEISIEEIKAGQRNIDRGYDIITQLKEFSESMENHIRQVTDFTNKAAMHQGEGAKYFYSAQKIAFKGKIELSRRIQFLKEFDRPSYSVQQSISNQSKTATKSESIQKQIEKDLIPIYDIAPHAKDEIDHIGESVAIKLGGKLAKAELKSKERSVKKIAQNYKGNVLRINDIARNTIVVQKSRINEAVSSIQKEYPNCKVFEFTKNNSRLGYLGTNITVFTKAGIKAEIQVNTPVMIYAKEEKEIAQKILGKKQYSEIKKKLGIDGGMGHIYYEMCRKSPRESKKFEETAQKSREYYKQFWGYDV